MKRKRISSQTALSVILVTILALLWLAAMMCVTISGARGMSAYISSYTGAIIDKRAQNIFIHDQDVENTKSGKYEYSAWVFIENMNGKKQGYNLFDEFPFNDTRSGLPVEYASMVYYENGEPLWDGTNSIYFPYITQENWEAGEETRVTGYAIANVDSAFQDELDKMRDLGYLTFDVRLMRFTGVLDGVKFYPQKIEYIDGNAYSEALDKIGPTSQYTQPDGVEVTEWNYDFYQIDKTVGLDWKTLLESEKKAEGETITLYTETPRALWQSEEKSFSFNGETYSSLFELLEKTNNFETADPYKIDMKELYVSGTNWSEMGDGSIFCARALAHAYPLKATMKLLTSFYVWSFVAVLALCAAVLGIVKRNLTAPLKQACLRIPGEWIQKNIGAGEVRIWREPYEIDRYLAYANDRLRSQKNEVNRLRTAVEYADDAENSRRRMVSDIAHELKTPLAIIQSYSEGLREHIAENKRDQYINVILDETADMDAMIMSMLELSRLEAGKVHLERDEFLLSELVQSVLNKLSLAIKAKELKLCVDTDEREKLNADESRITQVITNLVTNAIKYTEIGGDVNVKVSVKYGKGRFSIENTSKPLTDEALNKVWDTFYRADGSRTSEGSGLGLAIVKSIVELHGGICFVRNTNIGVEFGFDISCRI